MSDVEVIAIETKKGRASAKGKKAKYVASHPKVSEMVNSAISSLKERGGSSLQAIKKYIASHYKVDADKLAPFIKKYLKTAVASGGLVQTKGKGATGSFKMSGGSAGGKEKSATKAKTTIKKAAKPKTTKAASPKKSAAVKKAPAKKKPKKATPAKKPKPAAKKAKSVKLATKQKKPKASPKKSPGRKGKK